jgi:hypothetical protein
MTTQLVKYDAACRALTAAKSVDEVKEIHDKAEALRAYARQAKNKTLEIDAAEIRIRAERKLGEIEASAEKASGTRRLGRPRLGGSHGTPPKAETPTLAELGISKRLSARAETCRCSRRSLRGKDGNVA